MTEPSQTKDLLAATAKAINGRSTMAEDPHGLVSVWVVLADSGDLAAAARSCKSIGARLSMITALADADSDQNVIAYHFDVAGSTLTLKVMVPKGGAVDSIVPIFRNADWHEREFMEFYNIGVNGRADARRLFLDESVESHALERLIPLSMLANAASTQMLWERLTEKGKK